MQITTQSFTVTKAGDASGENEDAARPASPQTVVLEPGGVAFRGAIADGATETSFAGLWAALLADGWQNKTIAADDPAPGLSRCAADWRVRIATDFDRLPWFAQDKARAGAGAALLGVEIEGKGDDVNAALWRALSLGDCGLFLVRADALVAAFPYSRANDYHSRPVLVETDERKRDGMGKFIQTHSGDARVGDTFYLATDALAAWFLGEIEANRSAPWRWFRGLQTARERGGGHTFPRFTREQRALGRLQNDDTTLLVLELRPNEDRRAA